MLHKYGVQVTENNLWAINHEQENDPKAKSYDKDAGRQTKEANGFPCPQVI